MIDLVRKLAVGKPRVHGNGFLQLDLNEDGSVRLHIWDEELPSQTIRSSIHDHVFGLESFILLGNLIHIEYDAIPYDLTKSCEGSKNLYSVFKAERIEGTQNTVLKFADENVELVERTRLDLKPGDRYYFPPYELHDTAYQGTTMTLMRKINTPEDYGRPRVLVAMHKEPDNEFDRESFDEDFLWSVIEKACRKEIK